MNDYSSTKIETEVQLSKYDNSWFKPGPALKIVAWHFVSIIFFDNNFAVFNQLKCFLLRFFGAKVGERVVLKPAINIKYPWQLIIGDDVWVGEKVWIDNLGVVAIGNNVCISAGAFLLTGNHNYKKSSFDLLIGNILIEDGVWIGARSIICPGVTCKTRSILTAGSVATKNLEAFTISQGVPATVKN